MQCPACGHTLEKSSVLGVTLDRCPACDGLWFNQGELRAAKDTRLHDFSWYDLDLWKNDADFFGTPSERTCPDCGPIHPLTTIHYSDSSIEIDVCTTCHGIWLDQLELAALLAYVRENAEQAVLQTYTHTLLQELEQAVDGGGRDRTTLTDILTLIDFFKYKFVVEHQRLAQILANIPH